MTSDTNWGDLPQTLQPVLGDAGIDVPEQPGTLPDGSPSLTIGDVQGDAAFNHQQGDNPYGFQEDCGLVSCQDVLNQFGVPVGEGDVVGHAIQNGECTVLSGDPTDSGGTSADQQAQILTDYGAPAHAETGQSLEQLAQDVEQGHGTIIEVNAGVLWDDPQHVEGGGANHAVTVTGVARDPQTGDIQGFYINDSGTGQSAEFVPAQTMTTAWQDTGGTCVVTDAVNVPPQDSSNGGQ
jgi:Peptidase_C39 like family